MLQLVLSPQYFLFSLGYILHLFPSFPSSRGHGSIHCFPNTKLEFLAKYHRNDSVFSVCKIRRHAMLSHQITSDANLDSSSRWYLPGFLPLKMTIFLLCLISILWGDAAILCPNSTDQAWHSSIFLLLLATTSHAWQMVTI